MDDVELAMLAAPRRDRSGELHPFNAFYGHAALLKRYAGLPANRSLKLSIEHGLPIADAVAAIDERLALPLHLCMSPARAAVVQRSTPGVTAHAVGPLILYADALGPRRPARRSRVVLFPAHSTAAGIAAFDVGALLERTASYRADFDEQAVCLYWRDVQLGAAAVYRRTGIEVVTAGHLLDPRFLPRLREILASAAAVVSNEVGTHVVYAAVLGCEVWVTGPKATFEYEAGTPRDELHVASAPRANHVARLRDAFSEPALDSGVAADVGGEAYVRSPGEIRALAERAEAEYALRPWGRRLATAGRGALRRKLASRG